MPLSKVPPYTIHDIYALPDGERAELINGQMYMMAPPSKQHQEIVGAIYAAIREHVRGEKGKCMPYS